MAHVQIEISAVLRCCESALYYLGIAIVTIRVIVNYPFKSGIALVTVRIIVNYPFKSFSRCLADPVHISTA